MMIDDMALIERVPVPSVLQADSVSLVDLVSAPAFSDSGRPLLYSSDYQESGIEFKPIFSTVAYRATLAFNAQLDLMVPVLGRNEIHVLMDFENTNTAPALYLAADFELRIGGVRRALPLSFLEKPQHGPLQMHVAWHVALLPGEAQQTVQVVFQNRIGGMAHVVMESR